ncbi:MAG: hypothetical protein GF317_18305 [Candidatus Lokiarchaeota archaeon]|nr:hypothetical protein [Candidatus Lokiarchaeota archaeon]MBD3201467.1 hypothetical protein [Candidatus Lokiarchaeota archaeon]
MEFSGISVMFSYFDSSIGPVTYISKPMVDEYIQRRINSLMDIDTQNSMFEHSFQKLNSFNYMFSLESPTYRGGSVLCMLSICLEKHPKIPQKVYDLLEKYGKIFQNMSNLDLLLTQGHLQHVDFETIKRNFNTKIGNLYNEIKEIPEIIDEIPVIIIPGFFKCLYEKENKSTKSWISREDELNLFKEPLNKIIEFKYESAYDFWKKINKSLIVKESNEIKRLLLGSFLLLKLRRFDSAYKLAESAYKLSEKSTLPYLTIDAILLLNECASHLGMIMIFETALVDFDASCGLSNFILNSYERFNHLLKNGFELIEDCDDSKPDIKLRQTLLLMSLAKMKILKYKSDIQIINLEEAIEILIGSYEILKDYPFITNLIQNRVTLSLAYEILHDYEKTFAYLEDAFNLTSKVSKNIQYYYTTWILQRQGWNYLHSGYIRETMQKFQHSIFEIQKIIKKKDRELLLAKTQIRLCYVLSFQEGDMNKILDYFKSSEEILKIYNEGVELSRLYYVMGDIFKGKGRISEALNYYEKCEEKAREINNEESIGISLTRKAKISAQKLDLDQSLELYKKALLYFEKINHPQFLGITLGEIGSVYQALGDKEKALKFYKLGLTSFRNEGNELESYWILYKLVSILLDMNYSEAIFYSKKLIELRRKTNSEIVIQASKLVEALILSYNSSSRKRLKSIFLLEQIAEEKIIQHHLSHAVLIHLCEFLLNDMLTAYDNQNVVELAKYLTQLASISQEFHSSYELVYINLLRSKIAIIQSRIEDANKLINQVLSLVQKFDLIDFNKKVNEEISIIQNYNSDIEILNLKSQNLKERLEAVNFVEDMRNFIRLFNI